MAKKGDTRTRDKAEREETQKAIFLEKLEAVFGIVKKACEFTGIKRDKFYKWIKEDEDFKRKVDDIQEIALDFAEYQMYKKIKEGDTQCLLFYLRTKGRCRGYNDRREVVADVKSENKTAISFGNMTAEQFAICLADLKEQEERESNDE